MNNLKKKLQMRNGKILVMDDEAEIRYIFTKMLNRIGYEVEIARDGNEAIALFKNATGIKNPFDAVIMDLKMANLINALQVVNPDSIKHVNWV